jgi:glycerol-3-phosphate acyltransferase PlsX
MGADHGPSVIIEGLSAFLKNHNSSDIFFKLFGDECMIIPLVEKYGIQNHCELIHTSKFISPSDSLRRALVSTDTSLALALHAVKRQEAQAVVSCCNTAMYLMLAKIILRTLPGVSRPAIVTHMPTPHGQSVLLDIGANVSCDADNLFDFALMGAVFAKIILQKERPSIGLLNIGTEDQKGNDTLILAKKKLEQSTMNFYGFVEGNDINAGTVDVIVTDGFAGNIALKSIEGIASLILSTLKTELQRGFWSKIGTLLARRAFKNFKNKFDPRMYNGALWLGLNGIAIKSHGGADSVAFAYSVNTAFIMAKKQMNLLIAQEMTNMKKSLIEDISDNSLTEICEEIFDVV